MTMKNEHHSIHVIKKLFIKNNSYSKFLLLHTFMICVRNSFRENYNSKRGYLYVNEQSSAVSVQ